MQDSRFLAPYPLHYANPIGKTGRDNSYARTSVGDPDPQDLAVFGTPTNKILL